MRLEAAERDVLGRRPARYLDSNAGRSRKGNLSEKERVAPVRRPQEWQLNSSAKLGYWSDNLPDASASG